MIDEQKQNMILEILELVCHNSEINWKTKEVKTTRCLNECGKQQRPKKRKLGLQKYKKKERRRKETKKEKSKEKRIIKVKKVAEEQEIQNEEEEIARLEEKTKKLVPE